MASVGASYMEVDKSPSDEYSLRNCAVLSDKEPLGHGGEHKYVKLSKDGSLGVGDFLLTVALSNKLPQGKIGLSGVQREWCQVRLRERVVVERFNLDRRSCLIGTISVEVDFYAKPKTVPPALDTDKLAPLFLERLVNNVFVMGQQIVLGGWDEIPQLKKNPLKATILQMTSEDYSQLMGKSSSKSQKKLKHGILHANTRVIFERKKDSSVQLTGRSVGDSAHTSIISPDWDFKQMGIGGLGKEFSDIFRRAFASRVFPPDVVEQLGMKHVRGILLYGPPGTGKTLMARQIGKMLHAREPKIINGPEVLNKFVGESEANVRQLFAEAETEQKKMGINSALHIIIFDELDAICRQRGSLTGSTGVHDTVVNQLLAKMDGVEQLNNILLIGMTNRIDMIDEALLRPGRLEVQMEIGLPNETGRLEILQIHTSAMRSHGKLDEKVDLEYLASKTRNFSGAEIEGLVRSAQATAMNKIIKAKDKVFVGREEAESLRVTMDDFDHALQYDLKPAFGISDEQLDRYIFNGIIPWSPRVQEMLDICNSSVQQTRTSVRTPLVSLLLRGDVGSGKTALAAHVARDSAFPFVKIITPENMIGFSEGAKCQAIKKVFDDAYKSELSCVVVDDIERLFDFVPIGPRFSNLVLQALLVLLRKLPPTTGKVPHKLLIIGTTRFDYKDLRDTGLAGAFNTIVDVPLLRKGSEVMSVVKESDLYNFTRPQLETLEKGLGNKNLTVGIKKLLAMIEACLQTEDPIQTLLLRLQFEARLGMKEDKDSYLHL